MPFPLAAAAAGAELVGGIINSFSQSRQNRLSRDFAREMYQRQYDDSIDFWNRQNEYNLPANQMQRFREAGLNPNLIYGQQNTAGPISVPDVKSAQFENPRLGDVVPSALRAIDLVTNLEMKQAQIDNVRAQNDVIKQQALLMGTQISGNEASTMQRLLEYNKSMDLYDTDVTARKEGLRKLQTDIDLSMREDARREVMNSSSVNEAMERIKAMAVDRMYKQQLSAQSREEVKRIREDTKRIVETINNLRKEGQIKNLDVFLAREGVRPTDPTWYRLVTIFANSVLEVFK